MGGPEQKEEGENNEGLTGKDKGDRSFFAGQAFYSRQSESPCGLVLSIKPMPVYFHVSRIPETSKRPVTSFCRIAELNGITQTPGDGGA